MIRSVCDFLENSSLKFPEKVAFVEGQKNITYLEFQNKALALASKILEFQIKKEPILIILPKGIDALISFFGVARSGNFYSIIDEKMPKERVEKIIAKLRPKLIISAKSLFCEYGIPVIYADDFSSFAVNETALNAVNIIDTDLLYVLFTSGSTGEPKGVAISHKSVVDYTFWVCETFGFNQNVILLGQAPFYFDNSVLDIYSTVACSAVFHILPVNLFVFPVKIINYIKEHSVNTIFWAPSVLTHFANTKALNTEKLSSINRILFAGEAMSNKQLNIWRKALPNALYANLYGPTEITVDCAYYIINREFRDDEPLPMGKACENTELFIFDENMQLITEPNVRGELCVRGAGLSVGYYNDPEKTNAAFVQNPLQSAYEEKIYKTGDIAYYNNFGELVWSGRNDSQIKLKGHRIELGEIETALNAHEGVKRSACIFDGEQIIAFYESEGELGDLKTFVASKIQAYMVPNVYIWRAKFQENANGKIDRKLLKESYNGKN